MSLFSSYKSYGAYYVNGTYFISSSKGKDKKTMIEGVDFFQNLGKVKIKPPLFKMILFTRIDGMDVSRSKKNNIG